MSTFYGKYPVSGGGGGGGVPIYDTFADFLPGSDAGDLAVAADTGKLYEWTGSAWQLIASPDSAFSLSAFGSSPNANGLTLSGGVLNMQPADATHPGGVSIASQTLAGTKTFSSILNANGGIDLSASGTLTIGATNASTINIGNSGATVNIQGTTIYENTPQLLTADPLITVNHGGGAGSGQNAGIQIEEASSITGYNETSSDRNSWILKAPNTAGVVTITPGASGFVIDQATHNPVTLAAVGSSPNANAASLSGQVLNLQPADGTNPGVVTTSAQTLAGAKTFSTAPILSSLSASLPLQLDGSKNITSTAIDLSTSQATGILAAGRFPALTGDVTTSSGAVATTLATVNSNTGSWGDATHVGAFTVNGKGLITAASSTSIQIAESQVTNLVTDLAAKQATISFATVGSSPTAGGATISGGTVTLQPADGTNAGAVSTASQTFGGIKTFTLAPIVTALTSTKVVATDGSKQFVSLDYRQTAGTTSLKQSDAQANIWVNNCTVTATSTATAGGTTTLTSSSAPIQVWTGTSAQTIKLPAGTALATGAISGYTFYIYNKSTQPLTIQDNSAGAITSMAASTYYSFVCMDTATAASSWDFHNLTPSLSNPMTTGGDVIYGGASGTPTRLANGSAGQVLTSAGGTSAPTWSFGSAINAQSVSYTLVNSDDTVAFTTSSTNRTATLPTAVGISGKKFTIKKVDSGTGLVPLATTSSQTIDGFATTVLNLAVQNESITVESDGSNWFIVDHYYPSTWVAYTPTIVGAGTPTGVSVYSRRVGDSLEVRGYFTSGTATGSTASVSLGYGGTDGNVTIGGSSQIGSSTNIVGTMTYAANGATTITVLATQSGTALQFGVMDASHPGLTAAVGTVAFGSTTRSAFFATVPVVNWFG